ncbi:P-loop containing nucleoside triphosphate hydrolase protein, partial [Mycena floridula]
MDARWRKNPRENGGTLHGLESTLKILKDLGDVLQNVPYVSAVAVVALRILQIRNEIKQNKELALEVINRVAQRCRGLFLSLRSLAAQNIAGLEDLREDLERYQQLLSQIHIELQKIASQRSLSSIFQREKHKDALQRYLRDLAEFDGSFSTQRLTALTLQFHTFMARLPPEQTNMDVMFQEARPPEPMLCIGREDEHAFILDLLWKNTASRFAILGPGGIGKTTLAQSILNHPEVIAWFSKQLFVSCETLDTVSAILNALANVLHIADRGQNLQLKILDALRGEPKILCLDNFEDPWDLIRRDSEKLLGQLATIPTLTIFITMRGEQYPDDVPWTLPRFPPLKSLSLPDATTVFERISGHNDEHVTKLLKAVDCVPLAVDLLAHQALNDGTEAVWKRWEIEGLKLLDLGDGHDDRKSSVNASISLSLSSSRIANHPSASDILRVITYLPDGLEVEFTTRLQKFLPTSVNLAQSLRALIGASLLTKETTDWTTRHHMLAPIRQYVEQFVPAKDEFTTALVEAYVELMTEAGEDIEDHEKQKVTLPELQNVARVLLLAFSSPLDHKDAWFHAVFNYITWYRIHF